MDLTSKQRAQLRGMANALAPIVHIGKDGIGENLIKQTDDALEARELIKCRVLENSMLTAREAADALAQATRSASSLLCPFKPPGCTTIRFPPRRETAKALSKIY